MGQGDDQLSMDLGVPVEQTAWGKWVDPDRRKAQARKFMDYAGIREIPSEPWPENSAEVKRLDPIVAELFPTRAAAAASPDGADMVDAFVCFIGDCFERFAGARFIEEEWFGREYSFYDDVNPALKMDTGDEEDVETVWGLIGRMIEYSPEEYGGMFSKMADAIREYASIHEGRRSH
ncbi:hypothetical protein [Nocardia implantans]|uniref:Uncharacterized protein n=1 Tax=Nocardia implantans TaxID=3108168 RepID=A0ABU6AM95_9NOCA|nr:MULTISPECIES: hypothetical protein [unclassified Nocardia]MBF6193493.1 hypothetical protein [Nocardia beijingensis]MEA3532102.1 hypothetical protein [Nocardia sp. CDC192]MEB3508593.1 hypothetical protein [Nocardia sp. CDC186]